MSRLSLRCIRAAFVCLMLGIGLGAAFSLDRSLGAGLRPLHAELNLWGWVTLLIYGMGYHMLPRFAGRPLRWTRLADLQSFLAIAGVALASAGWIALVLAIPLARVVVLSGGALEAVAALLFALEIAGLLRPHPA